VTSHPPFAEFFHALWGYAPFPWQGMLAERVVDGPWPQAMDLPTASGKTACLEIAVWALAAQADRELVNRTAPRRVWFVVDRRIVVDEAYERTRRLAENLAQATSGPLKDIADRLRQLSGTDRPLAVARLRGGIFRDDGWARIPSQPAVITSTVDQIGSQLLFRGYGHNLLAAPIFAGLAANDSLIILDEAHCAVPFLDTLQAIREYRGGQWASAPSPTPFAFVVMSATPPADLVPSERFPGAERTRALNHPELHRRLQMAKPAELVTVRSPRGAVEDPLVTQATTRAAEYVHAGRRRVAIMVNRVRTAQVAATQTAAIIGDAAHVLLLTGRMRPYERDQVMERWVRYLRADAPEDPPKPVVVVATQCLEVGADLSFDVLITECASLDALRQRFGRLARLGAAEPAFAAILIRDHQVNPEQPDPIYGEALATTWKWLGEQAEQREEPRIVDFGFEALDTAVRAAADVTTLLAPSEHAPLLLPAHLDLLCQTAPPARPEPDVSLYLHGRSGAPEVSVVWRSDLAPEDPATWAEIVALCPPVSGEMLQAPLWRVRAWLAEEARPDDSSDVEGEEESEHDAVQRIRPCLLWRGRDRSAVARWATEVVPGEVVVVPACYGLSGLGQEGGGEALGPEGIDLWERARVGAGHPPAVRITRAVLAPWLGCPALRDLLNAAELPAWEHGQVRDALEAALAYKRPDDEAAAPPPTWWFHLLRAARQGRVAEHPGGGLVLFAPASAGAGRAAEQDLFADDDDLVSASGAAVTLDDHTELVTRTAVKLAGLCLPAEYGPVFMAAARWHDAGKLDPRFQLLLHGGDEMAAAVASSPLAKSADVPVSPERRRTIRQATRLPQHFRHEMLSTQLCERSGHLADDTIKRALMLHLVASHHGHARPFAPVCLDEAPPAVSGAVGSYTVELDAGTRGDAVPMHRADSGLAERFWTLSRRYGWWGLAYLEAILRLSDWYGSRLAFGTASTNEPTLEEAAR
jgi:CRISPR-associated endonuclease/helicase Cas3